MIKYKWESLKLDCKRESLKLDCKRESLESQLI